MPRQKFTILGKGIGTYPLRKMLEDAFGGHTLEISYNQRGAVGIPEGTIITDEKDKRQGTYLIKDQAKYPITGYSVTASDSQGKFVFYFEVSQTEGGLEVIVAQDESFDLVKERLNSMYK